jgi:hypothetical protein
MTRYDYQDGLDFYEQFRPSLATEAGAGRVYATGAAIIQNAGLLHFLEKFKRRESASLRRRSAGMKTEARTQHEFPESDTQELVYALAEMMRSAGELYGTSERKDHP